MHTTVVVRNRASIPVPADSVAAWRAVCQALGHRLFWDEPSGILHVDSHLDGWAVVLDPAHGGVDRGGWGPGGLSEADFVLDVALRAAPRFAGLGARVALTREEDRAVHPADRVAPVRGLRLCLYLSLHTSPAAGENRVEVVYHLGGGLRSHRLASHLARWLSRQTQLPGRVRWCLLPGSEEGYGSTLWRAGAGLWARGRRVAVLVYLGTHGDLLGESRLADPAFREACAQGLLLGVLDFLMEFPLKEKEVMRLLEPVAPAALPVAPPVGRAPAVDQAMADAVAAPPADGTPAGDAAPPVDDTPAGEAAPPGTTARAATSPPPGPPGVPGPAGPAETPGVPGPPRVVGGSVVVPGVPEGLMPPARASGTVRVPVSWPVAPGGRPQPPAGVRPGSPPSGEVPVRQPFG